MKNIILFSFALAMMASSSFDAIGIADTTQVHGINEVVVTGTNQATGKTQLLAAISGEVPSLFVSQRNIFGFGMRRCWKSAGRSKHRCRSFSRHMRLAEYTPPQAAASPS